MLREEKCNDKKASNSKQNPKKNTSNMFSSSQSTKITAAIK